MTYYYHDLEMWVRGHSRSLKMVSFESLATVSYVPSILIMAISFTISEIFSVKALTLRSRFGIVQGHLK